MAAAIPEKQPNAAEKEHPFFHYYAMLVHQQNMLQDTVRTGTYRDAIMKNGPDFKDKVVLDVGTGSGILAFFAAQAGARMVYAVEASGVARHARELVKRNGYEDRITVIEGKVEDIELPEKVDVIISEPMGFLLFHERMIESYLLARERFMKPDGLMMPSTGTIYVAPFSDQSLFDEQMSKVRFWDHNNFYGIDLSHLSSVALRDHFAQPVVGFFDPGVIISSPPAIHATDFATATVKDLAKITIPYRFRVNRTAILHGLACWFDVSFNGSAAQIKLSTAPQAPGTHWYQCRLLLHAPIAVNATQVVVGSMTMVVNDSKSYDIKFDMALEGTDIKGFGIVHLQDQMYHYLTHPSAAGQDGAYGSAYSGAGADGYDGAYGGY